MKRADPQHSIRPNQLRNTWRGFRRWRGTRPFWGGLLTTLAGLEIFSTTQMSLSGLSFHLGPTGFLSWLVPAILVTSGLLIWFSPQHRTFYAVVAAVTALFSLIGVNLGGFLVGTAFGLLGSSLAAAWVRVRGAPRTPLDEAAADGSVEDDGGPDHSTDEQAARHESPARSDTDQPATDISRETPTASRRPWSKS